MTKQQAKTQKVYNNNTSSYELPGISIHTVRRDGLTDSILEETRYSVKGWDLDEALDKLLMAKLLMEGKILIHGFQKGTDKIVFSIKPPEENNKEKKNK